MVATGQRPGIVVNMSSLARYGNRGQTNYGSREGRPRRQHEGRGPSNGRPSASALCGGRPRIGLPEDLWLAVKFALECDYFNGRCIDVDGGMSL